MFFVSRLDIILLLFLNIQYPWHVLVPIFTCGSNENGKMVLLFSLFVYISSRRKISSGRLAYVYEITNIKKRKLYRAYCPLADR